MHDRWWHGESGERFWLESTDRADIGSDLRAPLVDEAGRENWRYALFREAQVGDLVFHYDKKRSAITAVSRIAGPPREAPIVWVARGSYARERGARPVEVPGYRMPLSHHLQLAEILTLETLRRARPVIQALHDKLAGTGRSLYFPFELSGRPLRPLQGYAFKLPAEFVRAFPALERAALPEPEPSFPERELFHAAIAGIEAAAGSYEIANLQRLRARNRGLQRVARTIFGTRARADDWAFHLGGREELQFNVGLDNMPDGARAFRAGVAFSFEPSRSLPDVEILVPKVARFNAWMREHPEAFPHLAMWHWRRGERSIDYQPGPIPETLIRDHTFVFMGHRQRLPLLDPHIALRTFDTLLPLYEWVEKAAHVSPAPFRQKENQPGPVPETLRLESGRVIDGGRWIQASTQERTLDIFLRHGEIQQRLQAILLEEGCAEVITEARLGERYIDVVARYGKELCFYEVKTAATVRGCLREAIGQLLEYSLWPGATRPDRLIVVGEPALDPAAESYLAALNEGFPIPIAYRRISLE